MSQSPVQQNEDSSALQHFRLMDLPPEMRNEIYEMAFTGEFSGEGRVDVCASQPPSFALLQTSRQVHHESKQLFAEALRTYYEQNLFFMTFISDQEPYAELDRIARRFDFKQMKRVRVVLSIPGTETTCDLVSEPDGISWGTAYHERVRQGPGNFEGWVAACQDDSGATTMASLGSEAQKRCRLVELHKAKFLCGVENQIRAMIDYLGKVAALKAAGSEQ